ncbi:MAG: hypothetical protein ACLFUS_08795 [Candidatus Sumerlaeia bacterium]
MGNVKILKKWYFFVPAILVLCMGLSMVACMDGDNSTGVGDGDDDSGQIIPDGNASIHFYNETDFDIIVLLNQYERYLRAFNTLFLDDIASGDYTLSAFGKGDDEWVTIVQQDLLTVKDGEVLEITFTEGDDDDDTTQTVRMVR